MMVPNVTKKEYNVRNKHSYLWFIYWQKEILT
jgi:hypothetical protein